jgi:hypothetical protein
MPQLEKIDQGYSYPSSRGHNQYLLLGDYGNVDSLCFEILVALLMIDGKSCSLMNCDDPDRLKEGHCEFVETMIFPSQKYGADDIDCNALDRRVFLSD